MTESNSTHPKLPEVPAEGLDVAETGEATGGMYSQMLVSPEERAMVLAARRTRAVEKLFGKITLELLRVAFEYKAWSDRTGAGLGSLSDFIDSFRYEALPEFMAQDPAVKQLGLKPIMTAAIQLIATAQAITAEFSTELKSFKGKDF